MKLSYVLAGIALFAGLFAHPIPKFSSPSQAAKILSAAANIMKEYKDLAYSQGKASCCIKPEPCSLCLARKGFCSCAPDLISGKGICGECKASWTFGKGAFPTEVLKGIPAANIRVNSVVGVPPSAINIKLFQKYFELITAAKKVLVQEKRFNCCMGNGGCDECAIEQYCGCGINLTADLKKGPEEKKQGICGQCLDGQHGGIGRIPDANPNEIAILPPMTDMKMRGTYTSSMSQESSGTSWIPSDSSMYMLSYPSRPGTTLDSMGTATFNYVDAGGKRGDSQLFSTSMFMLMTSFQTSFSLVSGRLMISADPITNGRFGYPNLFQTGETAGGNPLKDRQHPHDMIMEASVTLSKNINDQLTGFLYLAPVGEPALGPPAFQHRPSAWDNPEAPIGHHWQDGTHISSGVVSAGINYSDKFKVEASIFTGREPDENRYSPDPISLDSYSGRLTWNPNANLSFGMSSGFLNEPERLEPGVDVWRTTASALYSKQAGDTSLALGAIFGVNRKSGKITNSFAFEGSLKKSTNTFFWRIEHVQKDEIPNVPVNTYAINKLTLGYIKSLKVISNFEYSIGSMLMFNSFPASLEPFYGKSPVGIGLFFRIQPRRMQ